MTTLESIKKAPDASRSSAFIEKLSRSSAFSSAATFYKLRSQLSFKPRDDLNGLQVLLKHDWGDGHEEEFYQSTSIATILPDLTSQLNTGEFFKYGNYQASEFPMIIECSTYIAEKTLSRLIFFYVS